MDDQTTFAGEVARAFRDHGITAALTALIGGTIALIAAITRKAFTNEALLARLDRELVSERERIDKQRAEDRKADDDRLERIETDIRAMRDTLFEAFQRNRAVGGAPASKHMQGTAFDIAMSNHDPAAFEAAAREAGFLGFGFYPRSGFMHVDLGPARSWGEPFPARATPFVPETPPAREVLADSRTLKGSGATGIATVGAAGVEVAQDILAETQSAILPLVPYLDTLRWVFIAVALIGIAVAIHARIDDWKRGQR